MKFLSFLIPFLAILNSAPTFASVDDLIIQSRLDSKTTSWLIDKTRLILTNSNLSDGLTDTVSLDDDSTFGMDSLTDDPSFQKIKDVVSKVFHIDSSQAFLRLRIPKIYYKVHSLHARPEGIQISDPSLRLKATVELQGVDIGLSEGVQLDFMIPNRDSGKPEAYLTANVKPVSVEVPTTLPPAEFEVDLETIRNERFNFKLLGYQLEALPSYVNRHLDSILTYETSTRAPITANLVNVNPVTVKLNHLTRSVTFEEFKPIVEKNLKKIIAAVIRQVGISLKDSIGPRILKTVFSKSIPSSLAISSNAIYTRYTTQTFHQPESNQLALMISGDLCTLDSYRIYQDSCATQFPPTDPIRILSAETREQARVEVREKISQSHSDVAVSVSEEYLNRLLKTTIDAKLWDSMLKEQHLELGPKGAFVILNQPSTDPELFLDVVYKGGPGLLHILINPKHPIRFPLRMSTKLDIQIQNEVPTVVIKIDKVVSTPREIINGIPEYDLPSHLVMGLRRKIASMILNMAAKIEGKNAVELNLPVFKGLGLEKIWYETSAYGRLNLYFKL